MVRNFDRILLDSKAHWLVDKRGINGCEEISKG